MTVTLLTACFTCVMIKGLILVFAHNADQN